ncbi:MULTISPECIES: ATP-binding protein [unclassified Streptomyces]|uniref:ATP-binding protein n=1 Tax=unclassified Streptomyces TaxID=2593676 RepID=UPI002034BA18|nr:MULTISPECIES: ATP-binding protein [unclassified Streptomyces]
MSGPRAARHAPSRHAVTGPGRQIRPQLIRAALLPTLAAGLSGAAAVIFTLQLGGGAGDRDARLWPVLTGCALLVVGALAAALLGAQRVSKAVRDRCEALRRSSQRGRQELRTTADRLERGETPPRPVRGGPTGAPPGTDLAGVDEFWLLSQELRGAREQAHATLVRLAAPAVRSDSDRKVEVFVNLARRLQSLVHREISLLDDLEDTVEDPDLLKELFHVDHLATRIRRHAENLAVLGGAASRRQWTRPIDLSEVLRSSVAEVEQYPRVKVVPPAGGTVRGHAVADVVHLLAELVENATVFSAPDTDVVVRAERVTAGIAVEVEDRGLGMPAEEQHRMNALLGDPDQINVRNLLADGRIGLFVVSALARRHGIAVELKSNIYGGLLAVLVLPQELLGAEAPNAADAVGGSRATSWGTGEGGAVPPLEPVRVPLPRQEPATAAGPTAPPSWTQTTPRTEPPAEGAELDLGSETAVPPTPPPSPAWASPQAPAHAHALAGPSGPAWPSASAGPSGPGGPSGPAWPSAPAGPSGPGGPSGPAWPSASAGPSGPGGPSAPAWPSAQSSAEAPAPGRARSSAQAPASGRARTSAPAPAQAPASGRARTSAPAPAQAPASGRARTSAPAPAHARTPAPAPDPAPASGQARAQAPAPTPAQAPALASARTPAQAPAPSSGQARAQAPASAQTPAQARAETSAQAQAPASTHAPAQARAWGSPPASVPVQASATFPGQASAPVSAPAHAQAPVQAQASTPAPAPAWAPATAPGQALGPVTPACVQGSAPAPAALPDPVSVSTDPPEADRPTLPRRRAQEHLAPQLRDAPAPRRAAESEQPVHDPGLMAAFQRGFGLAQSEDRT